MDLTLRVILQKILKALVLIEKRLDDDERYLGIPRLEETINEIEDILASVEED